MSTKVVVIGANGQVGKEVIRIKELYPQLDIVGYGKEELDITNMLSIKQRLIADNPQFVINCAAYTDVVGAEDNYEDACEINSEGVGYLAEVCRLIDATVIHFSTDYIFDGDVESPYEYTEEDKPNPLNKYGMSKYKGEGELKRLHDKHFIIRTSWVYSHYDNNFVNSILNNMLKKKELKVVADQYGSPTCATDLAQLALRLCFIECKQYGTYNFTSDADINWYTFADMIKRIAINYIDIDCTLKPIQTRKVKHSVKRPYRVILNCDKINETLAKDIYNNWVESLCMSMYVRFKDNIDLTKSKTKQAIEFKHLFSDEEDIAKLYRKINNLEQRLENRD